MQLTFSNLTLYKMSLMKFNKSCYFRTYAKTTKFFKFKHSKWNSSFHRFWKNSDNDCEEFAQKPNWTNVFPVDPQIKKNTSKQIFLNNSWKKNQAEWGPVNEKAKKPFIHYHDKYSHTIQTLCVRYHPVESNSFKPLQSESKFDMM